MKLKLFKKYFLTTSLIILSSFTAMMVIISFVLNNFIAENKYETLSKSCDEISEHITQVATLEAENTQIEQFFNIIRTVSNVSEADIFVSDLSGRVIVCACEEWEQNQNCQHTSHIIPKSEIRSAIKEGEISLTTLSMYERPHYVTAKPLYNSDNNEYAYIFATAPLSLVKNLLSTFTRLYLFSAIVPIIITFFAVYAMTYRLTKPLKLMSEAAHNMAKGDFSKRIPVTSDDEIGELSAAFNMMTNSLSQLEGMRKSFVANVSHELKTPMTTIGGFIDGILDGTIEPEKQKYYLNIVSEEVKRLSRLVQSMLSMAKLESGEFVMKPELFDLRELLLNVVISQEQRIEKQNLEIIGLDEIESISLKADRDLIYQAIYNLVDNAIKFTNDGGKISFSLKAENRKAVFIIKNTGKSIPQKDLNFIFDRFYKVDKSRSDSKNSTGLGLYIVKTIIKAHGGNVSVSSKENEYTAFKMVLPMGN